MSNTEYLPRNYRTSSVAIQIRAAEAVGEYTTTLLHTKSYINVTGVPLVKEDPLSFSSGVLEIELPVMATSLRWRTGRTEFPEEIADGYPLLTCYDFARDKYLGFIALPLFDFKISSR